MLIGVNSTRSNRNNSINKDHNNFPDIRELHSTKDLDAKEDSHYVDVSVHGICRLGGWVYVSHRQLLKADYMIYKG